MRNPYFDNAKLILIFLVVLGHFIENTSLDNSLFYSIFTFIYIFHMPAFILLSGYFSKNLEKFSAKIRKYLIYYFVFEIMYTLILQDNTKIFLLKANYSLWYLLSLSTWYFILPFFVKLKHPIIFAIVIGALSGYINSIGYFLSLSRTFVFFPFFITGYYLKETNFNILNTFRIKILSLIILLGIFIIAFYQKIPYQWLQSSYNYTALGYNNWYAGIFRIFIYLISSLTCLAFFAIIPRKKYLFTYMGSNTLNSYLLHGIIILLSRNFLLNINFSSNLIFVIFVSFALTMILSSNIVAKLIDNIKLKSKLFAK